MISVTEVLDYAIEPELLRWMVRVGPKKAKQISEDAIAIGRVVDQYIQTRIRSDQALDYRKLLSPNLIPLRYCGLHPWRRRL